MRMCRWDVMKFYVVFLGVEVLKDRLYGLLYFFFLYSRVLRDLLFFFYEMSVNRRFFLSFERRYCIFVRYSVVVSFVYFYS